MTRTRCVAPAMERQPFSSQALEETPRQIVAFGIVVRRRQARRLPGSVPTLASEGASSQDYDSAVRIEERHRLGAGAVRVIANLCRVEHETTAALPTGSRSP